MIAPPSSSVDMSVKRLQRNAAVVLRSFSIRRAQDIAALFIGRYIDYKAPRRSSAVGLRRYQY